MNDQLILNEKEITNAGHPQYYQIVIFVGSILYTLWGVLLSDIQHHYDPVSIRVLICLPAFLAAILSLKLTWFGHNLKKIIYTSVFVVITHYHFLLYKNHVDMEYVLGALILIFTIVNIVLEPNFKMIFSFFFVALSYLTCMLVYQDQEMSSSSNLLLHLFGVTTVAIFSVINYYNYKKISSAFLAEINDNTTLRRWSSVGQMAGGIAHEVNTPLSTMILTLENLSDKLEANDIANAKKDVQNLIRTGSKIGSIVHSLRLLTVTGGKFERDKVSLFDVMISAKNEYAERAKEKNIELAYMYNIESDGNVWGSSSSLKHVVSNLIKNAMDALENSQEKWIKLLLIENSTHYKILVQNSGPPIDKAITERIFEPFYTTKDVGTAMGIGLSISKTLVLAHGGTIRVDTKNPHVMFEVALPKIKVEKKKKEKAAA